MTRSSNADDAQPVRLRSIPATARTADGQDVPVRIVAPVFTRAELRGMVRRDRDNGWLTRGEARRVIARDKAQTMMDGPGSREPTPRTRTRTRGSR